MRSPISATMRSAPGHVATIAPGLPRLLADKDMDDSVGSWSNSLRSTCPPTNPVPPVTMKLLTRFPWFVGLSAVFRKPDYVTAGRTAHTGKAAWEYSQHRLAGARHAPTSYQTAAAGGETRSAATLPADYGKLLARGRFHSAPVLRPIWRGRGFPPSSGSRSPCRRTRRPRAGEPDAEQPDAAQ